MVFRPFTAKWLFAFALLIMLGSCRIYSFTGASIPPGARTISVVTFPNNAPLVNPVLGQVFTDALQDKFMKQTNLRLVDIDGHLHFEGSITGYAVSPVAITGDDQAALNRLTISVRVIFENELQPENNFERSFSRFLDYDSQKTLSEVEDELVREIVDTLVEDIFNQAVVNW
jgi:hypothetical protein